MTAKPDIKSQPQPSERPHADYLWHGGELVEWDQATVHISMMGWTSISSVFEGIRAYWNEERQQLYVFHLDAHLKRLYQSMKIMRMDCLYSPEQLTDAITDCCGPTTSAPTPTSSPWPTSPAASPATRPSGKTRPRS